MNGCSQSFRLDQAKKEMAMAKFHLSATNIKAHFLDH
jgi:hypothetical protein